MGRQARTADVQTVENAHRVTVLPKPCSIDPDGSRLPTRFDKTSDSWKARPFPCPATNPPPALSENRIPRPREAGTSGFRSFAPILAQQIGEIFGRVRGQAVAAVTGGVEVGQIARGGLFVEPRSVQFPFQPAGDVKKGWESFLSSPSQDANPVPTKASEEILRRRPAISSTGPAQTPFPVQSIADLLGQRFQPVAFSSTRRRIRVKAAWPSGD